MSRANPLPPSGDFSNAVIVIAIGSFPGRGAATSVLLGSEPEIANAPPVTEEIAEGVQTVKMGDRQGGNRLWGR